MRKKSNATDNLSEQEVYRALEEIQSVFLKALRVIDTKSKDVGLNPARLQDTKRLILDMSLKLNRLPSFKAIEYGKKVEPKVDKKKLDA